MRLLALLLFPSLTFAAPVPKSLIKESAIELILSADNASVLEITVRNNGRDPLELPGTVKVTVKPPCVAHFSTTSSRRTHRRW